MAGSCAHGNIPLCSVKQGQFFTKLANIKLMKKILPNGHTEMVEKCLGMIE
jgi:hypothetical protein